MLTIEGYCKWIYSFLSLSLSLSLCVTSAAYRNKREASLPTSALLRVRTPTQSKSQGENLDHWVSWQSSWQGSWQSWLMGGMVLASFRHWPMSATEPSSCRHDTAAGPGQKRHRQRHKLDWNNTERKRERWPEGAKETNPLDDYVEKIRSLLEQKERVQNI